jgi:hypothetical protein
MPTPSVSTWVADHQRLSDARSAATGHTGHLDSHVSLLALGFTPADFTTLTTYADHATAQTSSLTPHGRGEKNPWATAETYRQRNTRMLAESAYRLAALYGKAIALDWTWVLSAIPGALEGEILDGFTGQTIEAWTTDLGPLAPLAWASGTPFADAYATGDDLDREQLRTLAEMRGLVFPPGT